MPTPRFNTVSRGMHVRQPWDPAPRTPQSIFAPKNTDLTEKERTIDSFEDINYLCPHIYKYK